MTLAQARPRRAFWAMWGWPIVMGVLTAAGLVSALFSDGGFGDMLAWVALGIPVLTCIRFGWMRRRRSR